MSHPTKKEIQYWVELKEWEFAAQEKRNPGLSVEAWLQRYIFTEHHEIFFVMLDNELHEWLSRLTKNKTCFKNTDPSAWSPELLQRLKETDNKISRLVDF